MNSKTIELSTLMRKEGEKVYVEGLVHLIIDQKKEILKALAER